MNWFLVICNGGNLIETRVLNSYLGGSTVYKYCDIIRFWPMVRFFINKPNNTREWTDVNRCLCLCFIPAAPAETGHQTGLSSISDVCEEDGRCRHHVWGRRSTLQSPWVHHTSGSDGDTPFWTPTSLSETSRSCRGADGCFFFIVFFRNRLTAAAASVWRQ